MEPSDATPRELFRIGQVAERLGLSLRTIRYYEEMGLVHPETRTEGGFRLYSEREIDRLKLIKQMKPLGFTVAEMRELLDARDTLRSGDTESPLTRKLSRGGHHRPSTSYGSTSRARTMRVACSVVICSRNEPS